MVEQSLNIAVIQFDIVWEDWSANQQQLDLMLEKISSTDLVILPETFATGFSMNAQKTAQPMDGDAVAWMKAVANRKKTAICGSLSVKENNQFFNRFIFVYPDGKIATYDKRHLFSLTQEPAVFSAGQNKVLIDYKGWKICPQVCYDLRFPVWSRNTQKDPYDLLIYVANWPERRLHAWQALLMARAIENLSYVVGANRVGKDGLETTHTGDSMVIDPLGMVLHHAVEKSAVLTATLQKSVLEKTRNHLPFLKDGDHFEIKN